MKVVPLATLGGSAETLTPVDIFSILFPALSVTNTCKYHVPAAVPFKVTVGFALVSWFGYLLGSFPSASPDVVYTHLHSSRFNPLSPSWILIVAVFASFTYADVAIAVISPAWVFVVYVANVDFYCFSIYVC